MYTGERQVSTLRKKYLEAVLKQDVGFFDTDARTGDIVFSVSTDTLLVQDAISEKVLYQFDIQTPHSLSFFSYLPFCATFLNLFFFFFFFVIFGRIWYWVGVILPCACLGCWVSINGGPFADAYILMAHFN
jgi:ABC-type multidrug transport system fused ATPase/permease subunit